MWPPSSTSSPLGLNMAYDNCHLVRFSVTLILLNSALQISVTEVLVQIFFTKWTYIDILPVFVDWYNVTRIRMGQK